MPPGALRCCQVLLVTSNQRRVGLGDQMLGKVERRGGRKDHVIISDIDMRSRGAVPRSSESGARMGAAPRQTAGYSAARTPGGDWESGTGLGFDVMIVLRNGGLAASPPVRYTLEMAEE